MPENVNLDGSEEDFARLLVFHRIINKEQLQKAMEDRQTHVANTGKVETLRDTLIRTKVVISPLIFDVLRVASKVIEICTKCNATHHIHFYHPGSRYFCTHCKGPLRVTDPGQSLKWQPGELARSVNEINAPMMDDPSQTAIVRMATKEDTIAPPATADETMLDMGKMNRPVRKETKRITGRRPLPSLPREPRVTPEVEDQPQSDEPKKKGFFGKLFGKK